MAELARLLNEDEWRVVLRRARKLGCLRMLALGLLLARGLLGAELPASVARVVEEDQTARDVAAEVRGALFSKQSPQSDSLHDHRFPGITVEEISAIIDRFGQLLGRFAGLKVKKHSQHLYWIHNDANHQ